MCPRCGGFMFAERDHHGAYSFCIACGYVHEARAASATRLRREVEDDKMRRSKRGLPRLQQTVEGR